MEYYFTAQKMAVGYDNRPLIENIDFSLKRGEILTLIGPNGAGKSTILKSIARQLSLVSGTIYLDKSDVVTMNGNEFAKKMAVVLTDKLKTELMSCYDVVATGRYPYTGRFGVLSDEDKKAVDEAMELVNVSQIKDKDFTKISDGQRQRVMLSRAICQQPEIIVLDEPTSYLDIKYKLEFLSILQRLKRQKNLTVIMSLHELDMAKRVSDHILCIDGRYVDRYGTPEDVFTDQYVSGLFGITAGSFDETGEDLELEKPDGRARIFVIAGGGLGRKSFRSLQRKGIPFATGIIYENDLDYPAAKALSAEIVSARSFVSRAICQQPEIIVLDEPTSYLDIKYKLEFLSILQRLKRQKNLTVIMSLHELDMAKRVSDHILCIDGRYVDRYGTPEDVFTDQYVSGLFGITAGSFDETGEDLELEKPDGRARIFVIAGGGLGRKSFRSLQRKGIPFATGIIYENDLDYPAAKALSAEIVSARSFEPVDDALIEKAKELIDACEGVICDRTEFGTYEQFNSRLYEYAVSTGKIIKIPFLEEQLAQL